MSELVRQVQLGDITFGAPRDIELLHTPWGYYRFLGVSQSATREEIDKAYRRLATKLHPDRNGGDSKPFQTLQHIEEILRDDGGELGIEHSRRRHYDEVCSLDSHFDGFIDCNGDRTRKLSEIILRNLEVEKKQAEAEVEITKRFPEFPELKRKLESATSSSEKKAVADQMQKMAAETAGLPPEAQEQIHEMLEEQRARHETQQRQFIDAFRSSPRAYFGKVLDVFYVGGGNVTFGTDRNYMVLGIVTHKNRQYVLELVLAGDCHISGFPKVHFKAPQANVAIRDPNVEGIFHVVNGRVELVYESSTYGGIIRARAPKTTNVQGFVQHGDLYVPERFATGNWWEKKPSVDIAVRDGAVTLQLRSPRLSEGKIILPSEGGLEELLYGHLKKELYFKNIINEKNLYKKKCY